MNRRLLVLASLSALPLGVWLGCGDDQPPPLSPADSGTDGMTSDGAVTDGSTSDVVDLDAPFDAGPAVCAQPMSFGAGAAVPNVSTPQTDHFGAITADELTIAWMNAAGTVLYAERTKPTEPFGATKSLAVGFALDRVALSADGLTMIGVLTDRSTFAQVKRNARTDAFALPLDSTPFKFLNMPNGGTEDGGADAGSTVADPVLSADGKVFYFSLLGGPPETVAESLRLGGSFYPSPRVLKQTDLVSAGAKHRRPTGLSVDGRTLFFWDESTSTERAAFRESVTIPGKLDFTTFVTLGAFPGAQPSQTCGRLYFESPGSGGVDLFVADRK
ncbi:hypothetical protein BH09MYX1_BH09MYX1_12470 [soil metagenome]